MRTQEELVELVVQRTLARLREEREQVFRQRRNGEYEVRTEGGNWQRVGTKPTNGVQVGPSFRRRVRRTQEGGES